MEVIGERISHTRQDIEDALESVMENEKSSVGDKFETGREMARQELDKLRNAFDNLVKMQNVLQRINPEHVSDIVENGALVITDKNNFFVSTGLGRIEMDGETYLLISRSAPLMASFIGKRKGDKVAFNKNTFEIMEIY